LQEDSLSQQKMDALKAIVAAQSGVEFFVPMAGLAKAVGWFGPITSLVNTMVEAMRQPWFHGATSKEETAARLNALRQPGSFLVRFSEQVGADPSLVFLAISFINRENLSLQHVRITHSYGHGYRVGDHAFTSLTDLVLFFISRADVTRACPGSPYARIFGLEEAPTSKREIGAYGAVDD